MVRNKVKEFGQQTGYYIKIVVIFVFTFIFELFTNAVVNSKQIMKITGKKIANFFV